MSWLIAAGRTCRECCFYMEGKCELLHIKVKHDKMACGDFELG